MGGVSREATPLYVIILSTNRRINIMNYSKFRFTLDMHKHQSQVSVPVMRGDTAVQLYITLSDGGHPYEIGGSCFAILIGNKPNQPPFRHPCLIEGNVIRYDFTSETTALSGSVACEIVLYGTNGIVTAPCFTIVVDERISHHDGDISAEDEAALDRLIMAALNNERSVRNITSIDSIYESVDELPTDVGNGTTYVVINDDEKALYAFSDGVKAWIKIHDLQPHVAYIVLTGRSAGIYRYTMASPYLVSAEHSNVVNITSIDTIYNSASDLPMDVGNGTNYVVINENEKGTYAFDAETNKWVKKYDLQPHVTYIVLTGAKSGIYRYTMASPYLVSAESHTLEEAKEYTDAEIASSVGDIDTALDAIIAIQESLIGGDTE